jgi:hypothetical protein
MLEYFRCKVGNTVEFCSCYSSRSDGGMLRVWFRYGPFVPNEQGVKMTASNSGKQHAIVRSSGV